MTATFRNNFRPLHHTNVLHRAILRLSVDGYLVLKTTSGAGELPSIQIDKPFAEAEPVITPHAEKLIASCECYACRLYWLVEPEVASGSSEVSKQIGL